MCCCSLDHTDTLLVWQARIWQPRGDTQSNRTKGKGKMEEHKNKEKQSGEGGILPSSKKQTLK